MISICTKLYSLVRLSPLVLGLIVWFGLDVHAACAADTAMPAVPPAASDAETKAWSELTTASKSYSPPEQWRTNRPSQQEYKEFMLRGVELEVARLDGFLAKFPDGVHTKEARKRRSEMLKVAAMMGSNKLSKEVVQEATKTASDKSLPTDERVEARLTQLRAETNVIADKAKSKKAWADGLIAIQKDHPTSDTIYRAMMSFLLTWQGDDAKRVAKVVMDSPDARPSFRKQAKEYFDTKEPGA